MAASARAETPGSEQYQEKHMDAIFKEGFSFSGFERDYLGLNLGTRKFMDISGISGVDSISDGRGSVFADFDNDGDLDIFLTTAQGEAHFLFRNNVGQDQGFLRVQLEGTRSGRDAFGAVVRVKTSAGIETKIKAGGSGFLSQHDGRLLFGLGRDAGAEWVEVIWPGGGVQRLGSVPAGSAVRITEGTAGFETIEERRFRLADPPTHDERALSKLSFGKGEPFPDLILKPLSGRPSSLKAQLRPGRRTLVNLWASWCVPCRKEMPELQRLRPILSRAGVDLLSVSIDTEGLDRLPSFLKRIGITHAVYTAGEAAIGRVFTNDQLVVPISFLLDGEGRLLEVFSGWSSASAKRIESLARPQGVKSPAPASATAGAPGRARPPR